MNESSLIFFHKVFLIPSSVRLCWCIIEVNDSLNMYRLGVMLCGYDKVIDVAEKRFIQCNCSHSPSKAYPVRRYAEGDEFVYKDELNHKIRKPKSYIKDIYFRSVYSREMMRSTLI